MIPRGNYYARRRSNRCLRRHPRVPTGGDSMGAMAQDSKLSRIKTCDKCLARLHAQASRHGRLRLVSDEEHGPVDLATSHRHDTTPKRRETLKKLVDFISKVYSAWLSEMAPTTSVARPEQSWSALGIRSEAHVEAHWEELCATFYCTAACSLVSALNTFSEVREAARWPASLRRTP